MIDFAGFVVVTALSTLFGLGLLYFVVKSAIKNALIEDRAFQAKVARERASR